MGKWKKKEKGKKTRHIIYALYYTAYLPFPRYINMFFFLELLFLSGKAMWVAIDYRSKNWVAVLKGLGSTGLEAAEVFERYTWYHLVLFECVNTFVQEQPLLAAISGGVTVFVSSIWLRVFSRNSQRVVHCVFSQTCYLPRVCLLALHRHSEWRIVDFLSLLNTN
jgi:hypothetical protein